MTCDTVTDERRLRSRLLPRLQDTLSSRPNLCPRAPESERCPRWGPEHALSAFRVSQEPTQFLVSSLACHPGLPKDGLSAAHTAPLHWPPGRVPDDSDGGAEPPSQPLGLRLGLGCRACLLPPGPVPPRPPRAPPPRPGPRVCGRNITGDQLGGRRFLLHGHFILIECFC